MLRQTLKGTGVALVTPFNADKSIDFTALENLIDIQIAGGVRCCLLNQAGAAGRWS